MSEIWDKPITDTTDWGGDSSTGGLPVSGRQVQAWLKSRIAKILTEAQITKIIEDWVQKNGFADDEGFVTLSSDQEINGLKNFLQGLMVNGGLVKYDPELKVWQLNGNLLVTGGISMYSNLEGFTPSTIMDGILTDEVTITVKDGRLTVLAAESGLNYDELDAYLKKYEYTTISEVDARISELVNGAPQAYDTLKEIADVLQGNVNSIGDILAALAKKANTTYVDEAIADTKTWVEEQQYINEIDPSYIEAALGYQPYDGDTNRKEFTTKTYVEDNFVSRTLANEIEAIHNFLNGFTIAGVPVSKTANGQLFIDASVVFGGGVTMYGTDTTPAPSIFDGLPIDNETIYWDNGVLKAMGGGGGGGVADSVAWANVYGKPTWITNTKPTYNYSEIKGTPDLSVYALVSSLSNYALKTSIPTNNNQLTNGAGYITASALNGYATQSWVNTALAGYLPLSGGVIAGSLRVGADDNSRYNFISTVRLNHAAVISNTDEGAFFSFSSYSDGVLSTKKMIDLGIYDFRYSNDGGKTFNKILHAGNYSDLLAGGTINGSIAATSFIGDLAGQATAASLLRKTTSSNSWCVANGNALDIYNSNSTKRFWFGYSLPEGSPYATNEWHFGASDGTGENSGKVYAASFIGNLTGNANSATKLATPRTIWGQSFDGTGNVAGTLSLYPQTQTLNASSGVLRFYSIRDTISGPSIQGVHALQGYGAKHLVFYQHNTGGYTEYEAMRLTYDGNLVIGGTTANAKLHVHGNLLATGTATVNALNTQTSIWASKSEGYGVVLYGTEDEAVIGVHTNGNWQCPNLSLFANSNVTVHGNLLVNGGIAMYSQRSLKNILSYDGLSLEQLSVIKPIKFTWKDGRDNRYHVGGVADDVETVVPEVVYSANDFLTMDYGNAGFYVAASLIKPVLDHETRIEQLECRVKELEQENKQLRQAS